MSNYLKTLSSNINLHHLHYSLYFYYRSFLALRVGVDYYDWHYVHWDGIITMRRMMMVAFPYAGVRKGRRGRGRIGRGRGRGRIGEDRIGKGGWRRGR